MVSLLKIMFSEILEEKLQYRFSQIPIGKILQPLGVAL